jgi:hypothetical protein
MTEFVCYKLIINCNSKSKVNTVWWQNRHKAATATPHNHTTWIWSDAISLSPLLHAYVWLQILLSSDHRNKANLPLGVLLNTAHIKKWF